MFSYKFTGDYPLSLPSHGLDNVQPGDKVEVAEAINHPSFDLIKPKADAPAKEA